MGQRESLSCIRPYKSLDEALERVRDAREYQVGKWPGTNLENAGGRPFEEWVILMRVYLAKLETVYAETPEHNEDGSYNVKGLERIEKYAAIVANLALWGVQAAKGKVG